MIMIIEKVINKKESKDLIQLFNKNKDKAAKFPSNWMDINSPSAYPIYDTKLKDSFLTRILKRIEKIVQTYYGKDIAIEKSELKKHVQGAYHVMHYDREYRTSPLGLTSVLYLNEGFVEGHTYFADGTRVVPQTGRMIVYDGLKYEHGVSEIRGNSRYTIPCWYKKKGVNEKKKIKN